MSLKQMCSLACAISIAPSVVPINCSWQIRRAGQCCEREESDEKAQLVCGGSSGCLDGGGVFLRRHGRDGSACHAGAYRHTF
jgi:hypothetical protein